MKLRTVGVALCAATLAFSTAACGKEGSPDDDASSGADKTKSLSYTVAKDAKVKGSPTFKKIKKKGKITIGVKDDQPGLGQQDPGTKKYSGFDIEIARMLAASLGFGKDDIKYKHVASAARETSVAGGQVDIYVGTYTINKTRKKRVGFAGPYYVAGQDLLIKKDNKDIKGPDDLKGKRVCSAKGSTPLQNISRPKFGVKTSSYNNYSTCVDNLISDQVDAVTTDDAILLGYAAQNKNLRVVGKPFTKEPYGIGMNKHDDALRKFINDALLKREKNGDWKKAFDATLGASGVKAPKPPEIQRY